MAAALAFRGPDATHIATQPGAGFVFTFLRTGPAPQSPQQPCSLDGRLWLIGDVRLDGRDDLQRKLEQHGASIPSAATDEELILHAFQIWGEQSLPDLIGDYAFALWDSLARQLLCLRDLIGSRPFFFAQVADQLIFSNTLNVIRLVPQVSAELDRHFVGDFLLEGWCPDLARSAFRDIARLPPAHLLSFSEGTVAIRRFTSFPIEEPLPLKRPEDYVKQFHALLERAVVDRLPRGPVTIFLSGGLDSTSVAAIATQSAKRLGQPLDLRAFTVDYNPLFNDPEGALASKAAQHLSIPIQVQSGASCFPYADWEAFPPLMPEPLHDPLRSVSVTAIRRGAEHARVFFTGYGGDGIMTGQAWPYLVYLLGRLRLGVIGKAFGGYFLRHGRMPPLRGGFRQKLHRLQGKYDPMAEYPRWLAQQFVQEGNLRARWQELQQPSDNLHPWHASGYATLAGPTWSAVLETDDPAWHGMPTQGRSPLLDQSLQRFLLRVPPVPYCIDKQLLRQALYRMLPNEIRLRPKTPLRGDPLALHLEKRTWSPLPLSRPSPAICEYVNWENFRAVLQNPSAFSPSRDLRPLSLLYWMQGVANSGSVR
jgi:asparagine synthase (glutamine-hydrolysing)